MGIIYYVLVYYIPYIASRSCLWVQAYRKYFLWIQSRPPSSGPPPWEALHLRVYSLWTET